LQDVPRQWPLYLGQVLALLPWQSFSQTSGLAARRPTPPPSLSHWRSAIPHARGNWIEMHKKGARYVRSAGGWQAPWPSARFKSQLQKLACLAKHRALRTLFSKTKSQALAVKYQITLPAETATTPGKRHGCHSRPAALLLCYRTS